MVEIAGIKPGIEKWNREVAKIAKKYPDRILSGLYVVGERIMTISKREYVPVDEGILRSSGKTEKPVKKRNFFQVELTYGGAAGAYALVQHEDLTFSHTVGGPKYLSKPLLAYPVAKELAALVKL